MKAFLGSVVCAVVMTGFNTASVGATAPQAGTAAASDNLLNSRIEERIHKDPSLRKRKIDVAVEGGVATLTGTVATDGERAKAKQLATIKGVARVDNRIVVDQAAATTGTAATAKEKTKEGAEKVVDKTKEGLSKTGEVITDAWITTRVKSKFVGEDLLKGSDINVDTNDHIVTLKGTVMAAAARARAIEQAKEVEGVHKVVDHLTIGPKKP